MTTAQKTIDTLVEDIYSLFTSNEPTKIPANVLQEFAKDVTDAVVASLTQERKPRNNLRLSMIGQPARKTWYSVRSTEQEELSGSDYIKFLYGDILEALLVFLSKTSGHKVTDQQKQVVLNDVVGHQDAVVDDVLVDFKSASSFSFKKFTEGMVFKDDPFGYVAQLSAYAQANNAKEAGWVVIDKTTGQIDYLGLPCRVLDCSFSISQGGGHHHILCSCDSNHIHKDSCPFEATINRSLDITVFYYNISTHGL